MSNLPKIDWIEFDKKKHKIFTDGSKFLCAFLVYSGGKEIWEFEVLTIRCDCDWFCIETSGGETFDTWDFSDCSYFHLIEGEIPTHDSETLT